MLLVILSTLPALADEARTVSVEINKGQMVKLSRPASSIVIADPATADVQVISPKLLFIHGKKVGETTIYAMDGSDNTVFEATVQVNHNLSSLQKTIRRIAPNADIGLKTVDGGLVMDGFAGSVSESENIRSVAAAYIGDKEKMVNMITTAGSDQVMLKVRIVEMARNDTKKFGINLQSALSHGSLGLQLFQGNDVIPGAAANLIARDTGNVDSTVAGTLVRGASSISAVVDALETQGLATVLAEPSLTTTSGKAASFLAGGEFPLPVKDQNGAITIQYKPFGVSLNFTPVVMGKDRMSITVAPEVSTLDFNNPIQVSGITYPILMTRQASAVVELGSGDSFALAGLLQNEKTNNINKFPGLGDIPILGALFRSVQFQNDETELVILVTPYLVRPVAAPKLQTPMDGYRPPSDLQLLVHGNLYRQEEMTEQDKQLPAPVLHGGGFIEE